MERFVKWLLEAVRTAGLVVVQIVGSVRYNWGIGILSLGLAISLWVFVTDRENPDVTGLVPGTIAIEVVNVPDPENQALFSISEDFVVVRARASKSVFERLTAEDFRAVVDLSAVTGQQATVEVRVESNEPRAAVVAVSPGDVDVQLEDVTSVLVPVEVRLVGTPPRGFDVGETVVQPEEAVVTGPDSLVERVRAVEADVNLTGFTTNFQQTLILQARDGQGGNIEGVSVGPETAIVQLEITQQVFSAVFVVLPDVSGVPASGFVVTGIEVEPQFITISAASDVFQSLDLAGGVMTEAVVIDDANADVVRPVALLLPDGATVSQGTVTVRIRIEAIGQDQGNPPP